MKYRMGFVSNSSSSSFVILGEKIDDFEYITPILVKSGKIWVEGAEFGEGYDVFQLTPEIYKELKKHINDTVSDKMFGENQTLNERLRFYKAEATLEEGWSDTKLNGTKLAEKIKGKNLEVIILDRSQHSHSDFKGIEDYYLKGIY